jgi:endonuclease-3
MNEGQPELKERAQLIRELLELRYPEVPNFLRFQRPFELLVGVVLSAQSTDAQVNRILAGLMQRWPSPCDWARADLKDIEQAIYSTGYYRSKARNLKQTAQILCDKGGEVPLDMDELLKLPGVGRKSAHVLRGTLAHLPAIIVDTHFARVTRRLGLTTATNPIRIENDIAKLIPPHQSYAFSMRVNLHGRLTCQARKPRCSECSLRQLCPYDLSKVPGLAKNFST